MRCRFLIPFMVASLALIVPFSSAEAQGQGGRLGARLTALETEVANLEAALAPTFIQIDCGNGDNVASALADVQNNPAPATIEISGVCMEEVWIR